MPFSRLGSNPCQGWWAAHECFPCELATPLHGCGPKLPTLFAATAPHANGGAYYGPGRLGETRGHPAIAKVPPQAVDQTSASRLWAVSEQLTGVVFSSRPTSLERRLMRATEPPSTLVAA